MADKQPRDHRGRFAKLVCVNAHDRCYEGGPCPYCEIRNNTLMIDDASDPGSWEDALKYSQHIKVIK